MVKFDYITKENMKENILNWLQIPSHQYRILIIDKAVETSLILSNKFT